MGDVFARGPIPAGRGPYELAVLVAHRQGEPVELQLDGIGPNLLIITQPAFETFGPRTQLVEFERVVERHHPHGMLHRSERHRGSPANGRRRRIVFGELGVCSLELAKLADQHIEVGIGKLG